jgi:hypothetical protein
VEDAVIEHFGLQMNEVKSGDRILYMDRPYSFSATEECGNDVSIEFSVRAVLSDYEREQISEFKATNGRSWISNATLMDALCVEGVIPAGNYVVSVSW